MERIKRKDKINYYLDIADVVSNQCTCLRRRYGAVIVKNDDIGEVVGFINKCSHIEEIEDIKLFDYLFKDNNLVDNKYEGYHVDNFYGTHIIGPILVKNPCLMNHITCISFIS